MVSDGTLTDADVSATAALATTKLTGPVLSIANHGLGGLAPLSAVSGGLGGTISDGTLTDADVSASAAIADTKLATLATPGKVADSALSAQVTKLGPSINLDTGEVTGLLPKSVVSGSGTWAVSDLPADGYSATYVNEGQLESITSGMVQNGTLTDADVSPTAAIADTKLATLATPGKVADSALSATVTKLGSAIDLGTGEVTGILPLARGGTGTTALSGVVIGQGQNPLTAVTAGAGWQLLRRSPGNSVYEFVAPAGGGDPVGTWRTVNAGAGLSGGGMLSTDVTLALDLARANTWLASQTFSAGANFPGSGIWNTAGNVGIGTTGPGKKLVVQAGVNDGIVLHDGTNNDVFISNQNGFGVAQFYNSGTIKTQINSNGDSYFNGGNVGIGTTGPGHKLDVNGNIGLQGNLVLHMYANNDSYADIRVIRSRSAYNDGMYIGYGSTGGPIRFYGGGATNPYLGEIGSGGTFLMGGNVGIGTTGPTRTLDVAGRLLVREGAFPNGWDTADWGATVSLRQPGAANMASASHGNAQLELVSSGRNTPHIAFHAPGYYGANFGLDTDNWFSTQGWSAGGGYTSLRVGSFQANGNAYVTGNVGIGTMSPDSRTGLQIVGSWLKVSGSNHGDPASRIGVGNNWWMSENPNGYYAIHQNGVGDKLTIDTSGNVGIGTTGPGYKLHVAGGSTYADNYYLDGTQIEGLSGRNFFRDVEGAGNLRVGAAWGIPGIYSESGDVVVGSASGVIKFQGSSGTGDIRAGIFRDGDNTGYYLDPNGTSRLSTVNVDSLRSYGRIYSQEWIQMDNYSGLYSPLNGAHLYPNNASYGSWRIAGSRNGWQGLEFDASGGNLSLMMGNTGQGWGSQTTGVHNNSYGWLWRFEHDSLYAGRFYDHNDTNYYVDPNSVSRFADIRPNIIYDGNNTGYYLDPDGNSYTNYFGRNYGFNWTEYDWNNAGYYVNPDATSIFNDLRANILYDNNNTGYYADPNGTSRMNYGVFDNTYAYGWMQAPIFYDANDTGYYADPNGTSRMNALTINSLYSYGNLDVNDMWIRAAGKWASQLGGGGISGSGSANWIPRWTGGTSLGNSTIYNDGFTTEIQSADLKLNGGAWGRGDSGRALVHEGGDGLVINYGGDFTGGVRVDSFLNACRQGGYGGCWGDSGAALWGSSGGFGIGVYGSGGNTGVSANGGSRDFYAFGPGQDYASASSIRWKRNITPLPGAIDKLLQLRGVYFDWDDEHGGRHDVGVIAEEVVGVLPEIVVFEEDGRSAEGVDYSKFAPLLIEAVKEQQAQIEAHEEWLTRLQEDVSPVVGALTPWLMSGAASAELMDAAGLAAVRNLAGLTEPSLVMTASLSGVGAPATSASLSGAEATTSGSLAAASAAAVSGTGDTSAAGVSGDSGAGETGATVIGAVTVAPLQATQGESAATANPAGSDGLASVEPSSGAVSPQATATSDAGALVASSAGSSTGEGALSAITVSPSGAIGIGTSSPAPDVALDVAGTVQMTGVRLPTDAVAGYVLTTDAQGAGAWQPLPEPKAASPSGLHRVEEYGSAQAAVDEACKTGGTVLFPPAYTLSSTLVVSCGGAAGMPLTLQGSPTRLSCATLGTSACVTVGGDAASGEAAGHRIRDLELDGPGEAAVGSVGLQLSGTARAGAVNDVAVSGFETGIVIGDAPAGKRTGDWRLSQISVGAGAQPADAPTTAVALRVDGQATVHVTDARLSATRRALEAVGTSAPGSSLLLTNVRFEPAGLEVGIGGVFCETPDETPRTVVITNATAEGAYPLFKAGSGCKLAIHHLLATTDIADSGEEPLIEMTDPAASLTVADSVLSGSEGSGAALEIAADVVAALRANDIRHGTAGAEAIFIHDADPTVMLDGNRITGEVHLRHAAQVTVSDNRFEGSPQSAVRIAGDAASISIMGNTISGWGTDPGAWAGIHLTDGESPAPARRGIHIAHNLFSDPGDGAEAAISCGDVTSAVVVGNVLQDAGGLAFQPTCASAADNY
jgi:hypothetical protein